MDELATSLRAWRDRTRPEAVGLPRGGHRRAPGLRREELAALAGVSVEYLVRLEQGRARHPSPQLLGALARALRLTDAERDHLYRLAGEAPPSSGVVPRHLTAGVQRLLDRLGDVPLAVLSAAWEPIWWNPLWAVLTGDPSAHRGIERNIAWRHFMRDTSDVEYDDAHRAQFSDDLAADLREARGRYPDDPELAALVDRLIRESDRFRRHWQQARVARHVSSRKTVTRTPVGPVTVDCDVLTAPGTDVRIVVYTAEPGSEDALRLDLLRVTGLQAFA
ncbi:helix-turn-helix domain-containing protein [Jatrophihabitans fulvus]